jgi:hypothetical protein
MKTLSGTKTTGENFMPKIKGIPFRCHCGCNVFQQIHCDELNERGFDQNLLIYVCNACEEWYECNKQNQSTSH